MESRLLVLVSVLSVLGSLGLYSYAVVVRPEMELNPGNIADCNGKYVVARGSIREVVWGWDGELSVELLPGNRTPAVWLVLDDRSVVESPRGQQLLTGAVVKAEGVANRYRDRTEIGIGGPEDIEILGQSSLEIVRANAGQLGNASVCFAGVAFYKKAVYGKASFQLVDRLNPGLALNCTSSSYFPHDEARPWENGSVVRVWGHLTAENSPLGHRLVIIGGARGVELVE